MAIVVPRGAPELIDTGVVRERGMTVTQKPISYFATRAKADKLDRTLIFPNLFAAVPILSVHEGMVPISAPSPGEEMHSEVLIEDTFKLCLLAYAQVHLWIKIAIHQLVIGKHKDLSLELIQMVYHTPAIRKLRCR